MKKDDGEEAADTEAVLPPEEVAESNASDDESNKSLHSPSNAEEAIENVNKSVDSNDEGCDNGGRVDLAVAESNSIDEQTKDSSTLVDPGEEATVVSMTNDEETNTTTNTLNPNTPSTNDPKTAAISELQNKCLSSSAAAAPGSSVAVANASHSKQAGLQRATSSAHMSGTELQANEEGTASNGKEQFKLDVAQERLAAAGASGCYSPYNIDEQEIVSSIAPMPRSVMPDHPGPGAFAVQTPRHYSASNTSATTAQATTIDSRSISTSGSLSSGYLDMPSTTRVISAVLSPDDDVDTNDNGNEGEAKEEEEAKDEEALSIVNDGTAILIASATTTEVNDPTNRAHCGTRCEQEEKDEEQANQPMLVEAKVVKDESPFGNILRRPFVAGSIICILLVIVLLLILALAGVFSPIQQKNSKSSSASSNSAKTPTRPSRLDEIYQRGYIACRVRPPNSSRNSTNNDEGGFGPGFGRPGNNEGYDESGSTFFGDRPGPGNNSEAGGNPQSADKWNSTTSTNDNRTLKNRTNVRGLQINRPQPLDGEGGAGQKPDIFRSRIVWCKAVAAAIWGPGNIADRIHVVDEWGAAVDVSIMSGDMIMNRNVFNPIRNSGTLFTQPLFYENGFRAAGQPHFVECAVEKNFRHLDECSGLQVCVVATWEMDAFVSRFLPRRLITAAPNPAEVMRNFGNGHCNVILANWLSNVEMIRRRTGYEGEIVMSDSFTNTKISNSMIVSMGDSRLDDDYSWYHWRDFLNAVLETTFVADMHHITQETSDMMPDCKAFGGLYKDMFRNVIQTVGSYSELYQEHYAQGDHTKGDINSVNNGTTGLIYSFPLGDLDSVDDVFDNRELGLRLVTIMEKGYLNCGVRFGREGFATWPGEDPDASQKMGMDVDYCRLIAAGLFGSDKQDFLKIIGVQNQTEGYGLLATDDIDVLAGATWNLENDVKEQSTGLGFAFSQPYFYSTTEGIRGGEDENLCLATMQDDHDWITFVYWMVAATIHAEENNINRIDFNSMPTVHLYGSNFTRMFQDGILAVGNYGEIYARNLEDLIPRSGRNLLNPASNPGPQHYAMPGIILWA